MQGERGSSEADEREQVAQAEGFRLEDSLHEWKVYKAKLHHQGDGDRR